VNDGSNFKFDEQIPPYLKLSIEYKSRYFDKFFNQSILNLTSISDSKYESFQIENKLFLTNFMDFNKTIIHGIVISCIIMSINAILLIYRINSMTGDMFKEGGTKVKIYLGRR